MLKKSRKIPGVLLLILILLTASVSCAATGTQGMETMPMPEQTVSPAYTDIRGSWAYEAISYVLEKGLFEGTSETTFSPDQVMTKTGFEAVLERMAGEDPSEDGSSETAGNASTNSATPDSTNQLTRENMAVMLYDYIKTIELPVAGEDSASDTTAKDSTEDTTGKDSTASAIGAVTSLGLMSNKSDGSFGSSETATRAEAATVIYRLCMLIDQANTSDSLLSEISDKTGSIKQYTDYAQDDYQTVTLKGNSISFTGSGAMVDGNTITVKAAGTYVISGTLKDGRIVVDSADDENVRLILNNANIASSDGPPILVRNAKNTIISLPSGTENTLADSSENTYEKDATGAVFSADDLWINGSGTLTVQANYKDGISGNDDVKITQATVVIDAADDGITANDSVSVNDAVIKITADGDGIKTTKGTKIGKGYISIKSGSLDINAGADGLQAETLLYIQGGSFNIATTEINSEGDSSSAKGLKAGNGIVVEDGSFKIDSGDDALHSNGIIRVKGGTFEIQTGDDAIHADSSLSVSGGEITISKSYEGLESKVIDLSGGTIDLTASDDGINVSGGDSGGMGFMGGRPGEGGASGNGNTAVPNAGANANAANPNAGAKPDSGAAGKTSDSSSGRKLTINGGNITVNAAGDGLDANGSIYMTGGTVLVNGPTDNGNGALDYDGVFEISGGTLLTAGSSSMAMAPSTGSTQYTIANTVGAQTAGTEV
ncbi:MAG TPA: carbohydrate-binding domain-containing protein, partial [Bacillota bacterium]|nr:carbohydrate-binding domain-containing protein [Bacillota bacterium]